MVDTGPTNFKPLQLNGCKGFLMLKIKFLLLTFFTGIYAVHTLSLKKWH